MRLLVCMLLLRGKLDVLACFVFDLLLRYGLVPLLVLIEGKEARRNKKSKEQVCFCGKIGGGEKSSNGTMVQITNVHLMPLEICLCGKYVATMYDVFNRQMLPRTLKLTYRYDYVKKSLTTCLTKHSFHHKLNISALNITGLGANRVLVED